MDSSTSEYCKKMESAYGGKMQLAAATGSSAYERFTIHQISKFAEEKPDDYKNTERISLISSFAVSLFLGDYAPVSARFYSLIREFAFRSIFLTALE